MAPLKIGLTGGIAAGKSEALAAFGRLGAATVSSDAIVHELLDDEPMLSAIAERWGAEVIVGRRRRPRPDRARSSSPTPRSWPGWSRASIPWSASGSPPGSTRCRPIRRSR